MFGIPGAGKTTIATIRFSSYRIIDPDLMRPREFEDAVRAFMATLEGKVGTASAANVVYSETSNADRAHVDSMGELMTKARRVGYMVRLVYVKTELSTALARIANRERKVPPSRVRDQASTIEAYFRILERFADQADVIHN